MQWSVSILPNQRHPFHGDKTPRKRQRKPRAGSHTNPQRGIAVWEPELPSTGSSGQQAQPWLQQGGRLELTFQFQLPTRPCHRGPWAGAKAKPILQAWLGTLSLTASSSGPLSSPVLVISLGTPAGGPSSHIWEHCTGAVSSLTLEGGPLAGVPVPASLHEAQQVAAGPRPGSADGRQLRAVALHHLHHDVQDVLLICKGKAHESGQSWPLISRGDTAVGKRRGVCRAWRPLILLNAQGFR